MDMSSDFPGNVVSFFRNDLVEPDRADGAFLDAIGSGGNPDAGILAKADISAIGDGAARVAAAMYRMVSTPEDAGTLGFALDGLTSAERSPQQAAILSDIESQLLGEIGDPDLEIPPFLLPDQLVVREPEMGANPQGLGFDSAFVPPTPERPTGVVLLSESIGFRETQLALQDQIATAFAIYAEDVGVELAPGDAGIRLARALRGEPDALGGLDTQLSRVDLTLGDATLTGLIRT